METPIYWNLIYEHIKVRFLPSKKVDFYHFQGWPFKWHLMKNLFDLNPLSANPIKWPNTLKQFVGNLLTNCLSVFGHFVGLALKGLRYLIFCPDFFCHAGKGPKEAKANFTIYEVIHLETNKSIQKMEFGRLYNVI